MNNESTPKLMEMKKKPRYLAPILSPHNQDEGRNKKIGQGHINSLLKDTQDNWNKKRRTTIDPNTSNQNLSFAYISPKKKPTVISSGIKNKSRNLPEIPSIEHLDLFDDDRN